MKFIITSEEQEREPEMHLYFHKSDDGTVYLKGSDAKGGDWFIFAFTSEGVVRQPGIKSDTGWPLEDGGRIKVIDHASC